MSKSRLYYALWLCSLVSILLIEEISTTSGIISSPILPPVSSVLTALLVNFSAFMAQLGITFSRWFVSTLIIIVAGIPLSLAIGGFSNLRRVAMPMIILSFSVPVIVFYPVFVFWGYDEASYVIPAVIGAFPPLCIAVVRSMENTGRRYYKIGRSFSYSKQKIIRKIMLPAVILDIFGGLRTSLNAILVIVVTIEMISTSSGIGSEIQNMFSRFMVSDMLAAVMVTAAFGLILNFSFSLAVKKMWVIR